MVQKNITFWDEYLTRLEKKAPTSSPEQYVTQLRKSNLELKKAIETFRQTLAQIPIGAEIHNWLQGLNLSQERIVEFETNILLLIDLNILKVTNEDGAIRTLNDLSVDEHQNIIESIRCLSNLSIPKKESMVNAYVAFSQHLSRQTQRLILQGEDPDFQRTTKKVVFYTDFIQFIQLLREREALIAKLLYFGAPTMDEVLSLKAGQVNPKENMIKYQKYSVEYPKHVIQDLKGYLHKKKKEELVFVNMHNMQIERTHINNCFNRASKKLPGERKVTPKMLLESDIAKSISTKDLLLLTWGELEKFEQDLTD